MVATITVTGNSLKVSKPVALFPTHILFGWDATGTRAQYDVARVGRFLINTVVGDAALPPIIVVQNWRPK